MYKSDKSLFFLFDAKIGKLSLKNESLFREKWGWKKVFPAFTEKFHYF